MTKDSSSLNDIVNVLKSIPSSDKERFEADPTPPLKDQDIRYKDKKQNLKFKKLLVNFILERTKEWIWGLGVVFAATGTTNVCCFNRPFLSDSVLIALISGTSLMGLIAIILRSLFKSK